MKSLAAVILFISSFTSLAQYSPSVLDTSSRKEVRSMLLKQNLSAEAKEHALKHQKYRNTGNNILLFSGALLATAATLQATLNFENMSPWEFLFVQFGLIGGSYIASGTGFIIGGTYHLLSAFQLSKAKRAYLQVYPSATSQSLGFGLSLRF